ncbi:MAG: VWA domain-containing protein [Gemmatimonadota bacterium]|nr:VWA domain-containing protein [Gemmatimonadota bacterium]
MIFERPELLALGPLVAILFAFTVGAHWRRLRTLAAAYQVAAIRRLLPTNPGRFPTQRFLCLVGAGALLGLTASGPVLWEPAPPEPGPPLDIAIAVDLSLSMNAASETGSRIERAQQAIDRLTSELPSVRFSLVVFAGWPYTLVPPTDDPNIVRYFVGSLRPEVVQERDRGNSLTSTLELALRTLESRPSEGGRQAILVMSDGDVFEEEDVLVRRAAASAARGFEVWIAGVGSQEETPISVAGEPVVDAAGRAVRTSQNAGLLRAMADAGQGRYEDITGDGGLDALVDALRDLSGDSQEGPAEPFDTTALFALLAIPLLLWEGAVDARRGVVGRGGKRKPDEPDAVRGHDRKAAA